MQAGWLFWAIAAAVALGSLGVVLAPLWRGRAASERRASYDLQVFRDQLREIDADLARGVLSPAEAGATRIEVSRRLLAAADAEAADVGDRPAPAWASRRALPALLAVLLLATAGLYARLGAPGLPDQPLQARLQRQEAAWASRPGQVEAEAIAARHGTGTAPAGTAEDRALLERLQKALESRPADLAGHRLLARSLAALKRWPEARAAQERVLALLGDQAVAQDYIDLAELSILAAGGFVSPEAERALTRGLTREPANPVGRYYSGLTLLQGGRPDLAYHVWAVLLDQGPPDAPWIAPIAAEIDEVGRMAGLPPRAAPAAAAPAGPSAAEIGAAGNLPPAERQQMIEGMVSQLSDRLAAQGGPPADWARLIRSLAVLGRRDEAAKILAEARDKHAGDASAMAEFDAAAHDAGLAE